MTNQTLDSEQSVEITEARIHHLEIIQDVISRMANNSFLLKGWSITIVGALSALAASKDMNTGVIILALLPAILFWCLDGFYMRQERLFRQLYNDIVNSIHHGNGNEVPLFCLDTRLCATKVKSGFRALFARSVWPFHSTMVIAVILFIVITVLHQ